MKKHQTVQIATGGQIKELASALVEAIPSSISADNAQYWIGKKGKLASEVRKILIRSNGNKGEFAVLITEWQSFWKGIDGKDRDFSNICIPKKPEGNWRLLVIADIALETLYAKCKERFKCWRWINDNNDNLDKIVTYNERDAKNGPYAIWVRDEMEADEKYKNLSANDIKGMNIKTETLAERLIHELKYLQETNSHLDIKNITLCAGSRYSDSDIPRVYWNGFDGELRVSRSNPGSSEDSLRARAVSN